MKETDKETDPKTRALMRQEKFRDGLRLDPENLDDAKMLRLFPTDPERVASLYNQPHTTLAEALQQFRDTLKTAAPARPA